MTDEWFNDLYHQAGIDLYEAHIKRLVSEFQYLGSRLEETQFSQTEAGHPAVGDEAS